MPIRHEVADHRRAADRDERQRDARDRRDADRHADVDEDLEEEAEHDPGGEDGAEEVPRPGHDLEAPPDDEQVEEQEERRPEEAALLGEGGEGEVGVVRREVVEQRLGRTDDPAPLQPSGADGDHRLGEVVGGRVVGVRGGMREAR